MARPLRTAAVLSLCAILIPTGCDSPTSLSEVAPSAAVTGNGTVVTTVKDVVPIDGHFVSGECLNDFELFTLSGELGVVHRLTLTPTSGGKTYLLNLDTQVWSQGIRGVGQTSGQEWWGIGADKIAVTEEEWTPGPLATAPDAVMGVSAGALDNEGGAGRRAATQLRLVVGLQIGDDFSITTTVEDVQLVCPPPSEPDDGTIIVTKQDKLDVDTEVTTPCFNDGVDEEVKVSGVLGVVHHLKLTPTNGQTYAMDLSTVAWSEGIQVLGRVSAAEALAVGADKSEVMEEVTLPTPPIEEPLFTFDASPPTAPGELVERTPVALRLTTGITEDFGITTTLVDIEVLCPPPPIVDN